MSSNYPPGVTGCEPQIVGYRDDDTDELAAHLADSGDVPPEHWIAAELLSNLWSEVVHTSPPHYGLDYPERDVLMALAYLMEQIGVDTTEERWYIGHTASRYADSERDGAGGERR